MLAISTFIITLEASFLLISIICRALLETLYNTDQDMGIENIWKSLKL